MKAQYGNEKLNIIGYEAAAPWMRGGGLFRSTLFCAIA